MTIRPVGVCLLHVDVQTDRQTDMTKLTAAIRFASEPKKNAGLLHKITCKQDKTQNYRTYSVLLQNYEL